MRANAKRFLLHRLSRLEEEKNLETLCKVQSMTKEEIVRNIPSLANQQKSFSGRFFEETVGLFLGKLGISYYTFCTFRNAENSKRSARFKIKKLANIDYVVPSAGNGTIVTIECKNTVRERGKSALEDLKSLTDALGKSNVIGYLIHHEPEPLCYLDGTILNKVCVQDDDALDEFMRTLTEI